MIQEDFYSGERISPEDEAASLASIGQSQYDYDPGLRALQQQQINVGNPPTPPGIGSPVMLNQFGNPVPTYNQFRAGYNPGYGQQQYVQQQQDQPRTLMVKGINNNGEYLPPIGIEDKIEDLKKEYWSKYQEQQAENNVKSHNSQSLYGGFNYYGTPYYNPWQYNSLVSEINKEVEDIKQSARQNRLDLNMQLSKLAHNFAHENIADEVIRERYEGKVIELPVQSNYTMQEAAEMARIDNMVEFDNSGWYQEQYRKSTALRDKFISKDATLEEMFENMGIVFSEWEMEEEAHRRKDLTSSYNSADGSYRYFVRKKAEERYARENGIDLPHVAQRFDPNTARQQSLDSFSTLRDSVTLSEDGTLNVTCNVGSHSGQVYSVNQEEAKYQERYNRFRDQISGSIYRQYND